MAPKGSDMSQDILNTILFWQGEASFEGPDGRHYICPIVDLLGISVEDPEVLITFDNFIIQHLYYDTD